MTSIIKLEPLNGVSDGDPLCYILQVDQFQFLLDCGWDEQFEMAYVETLKRRAPSIDAVLLSYSDVEHLGALPYLVGKCGLSCPIYATVPVYKMGQMFLYDWFLGHSAVEDFTLFTLDDVDAAFDKVQQLKYSQQVSLKGRGDGLQITPIPAGHMIGGTIWRVTKMGEEEIVYAVDFNHKKERHLNGCMFEGISRPNLLITDAFNATYKQPRRIERDRELVDGILETVRSGGDVLIVIDTAGRVLELAHLLDQLWHNAEAGLITYSLAMISYVTYNVVEFAKSQVEWMSDKILKAFEEGRYNPFQFRHVQLCHNAKDLAKLRSPKVVLASTPDMESGFSRELFLEWCADPKNSIILTSRRGPRALASKLIHMATGGPNVNRNLTLEIKRRIRLEGLELEAFYAKKKEKEQDFARQRLESQRRQSRVETIDASDDSDDDEAIGGGDNGANISRVSNEHPYDIMFKFEQQHKFSYFKQSKKSFPVYPCVEEKVKWDDYGEIIRPEDYMLPDAIVAPAPSGPGPAIDLKRDPESMDSQGSKDELASEIPSKCISSITKLEVLCQLKFIDFEGRSDGESIKKLLNQIKPKQLVFLHASTENVRHMQAYCQSHGIAPTRVFAPRLGEIVDATIESHIYQALLSDGLMNNLLFQSVKEAELAWVDARLTSRVANAVELDLSSPIKKNAGEIDENAMDVDDRTPKPREEGTFSLDALASNAVPAHAAVFVNDPKLSDIKQLLIDNSYQAEFSSGVLYVNNVISIRRSEAGKFHLEGAVCQDFYDIRKLIYGQFAIV